jgi:hypothetical protein
VIIHIYTVCHNEERILPFFLRYYEQFASKIFIYDNESNDRTVEIAKAHPLCEVTSWSSGRVYDDTQCLTLKRSIWKKSREVADWVFVVDCDEFIWSPDIMGVLKTAQDNNVALLQGRGWDMVSRSFDPSYPGQIYDIVKMGVEIPRYFKFAVFDPNRVKEMIYSRGSHNVNPILFNMGRDQIWRAYQSNLQLLHYKCLGLDYMKERLVYLLGRLDSEKTILYNDITYPGDLERLFIRPTVDVFEAYKIPTTVKVIGLEDPMTMHEIKGLRVRENVRN